MQTLLKTKMRGYINIRQSRLEKIKKDKESLHIHKSVIHHEVITILNISAPKDKASQYMKQK